MQEISFSASEYQADQSFQTVNYLFRGTTESGWTIERNGKTLLELGAGYVPVRTRACGICATDLVRYRLPFPLPQITGHEVTGVYGRQKVAIEINASHQARGIKTADCLYCRNDLDIHCPQRLTLGIDRLPGGFSPWVLAPVRAIHVLPENISAFTGALIEPFAAALKAVVTSPPRSGDKVAVLGPRRLGMLLIAALSAYRQRYGGEFEIVAVMRHARLQQAAQALGADTVALLGNGKPAQAGQQFDIVFDTTGNVDGFALAASMTRRTLHLKSTHGQAMMGLEHITSMVINEQGMRGMNGETLAAALAKSLRWPDRIPVYVSPAIDSTFYKDAFDERYRVISAMPDESENSSSVFDMALVSSIEEINRLTRPRTLQGQSLLRAGGVMLLGAEGFRDSSSDVLKRISLALLELATSRCGHFSDAIDMLQQQAGLAGRLEKHLISDILPVSKLAQAFQLAAQSDKSIKLVIDTGEDR